MTKEMLSPSLNFGSSHDVRSSVSGLAPIGNMFSPIPCSVAQDKDVNLPTPQQSPFVRTEQRCTLQGRIFDNVPELTCEPKVEQVIVETVDEESVGSIDCYAAKLSVLVSEDRRLEDSQQDATVNSPRVYPDLRFDQRSPLGSLHINQPRSVCEIEKVLDHVVKEDPLTESNPIFRNKIDARQTMEAASSPVAIGKGLPEEDEGDCFVDVSIKCQDEIATSIDHENFNDSFKYEGLHRGIAENDEVELRNGETCNLDDVQLNDSFASTGSNREEEIQQAQYVLGATSMAFMDRLRGASLRRKMNLARNRDSLVNKEKAQREAIAAFEAAKTSVESQSEIRSIVKEPSNSNQFKARPLSKAILKSGGISGVRFVEKRPVTTPCSPLLGSRRENHRQSLEPNTSEKSAGNTDAESCVFKARPWPRKKVEHAGTYGVPKVEKRPTTVPESPLLGHRRRKVKSKVLPKCVNKFIQPDLRTPPLPPKPVNRPVPATNKENTESMRGAHHANIDAYVPHSTLRASQRAEYDVQRCERDQRRRVRKRRESLAQVKALREELNVLLNKM
jgi:hypothetical protein